MQKAESNRLKARTKRKALAEAATSTNHDVWKLFKCRKISPSTFPVTKHPSIDAEPSSIPQQNAPPLPEKFRARIEISSPDSFFVVPEAIKSFPYTGEAVCLDKLGDCRSNVVLSYYTQNYGGGKACAYKLRDYNVILRCLKNYQGIEIEEIP